MDLEWNHSKRPLLVAQHIGEFLRFLAISFMNWILTVLKDLPNSDNYGLL